MSADRETIAAYETRSHDYAELVGREAAPGLAEFVAGLPQGGHVLDLGCGPGDTAHRLLKAGFTVDALDATPAMVSRARELGVEARLAAFEDLAEVDAYDGAWANFSLLHAERDEFPGHLARVHTALRSGGRFHIGMKLGAGEARDHLGRFYVYYTEDELVALLEAAGFCPTERFRGRGAGLAGDVSDWIWIHADG